MLKTYYNKNEKLWSGRETLPLYNPKISLGQALLSSMTMFSSKTAQISDDSGVSISFDDIRIKTIRAAQNLQKRGYQPKQVFGLLAKNSEHLAPIVFASLNIGCPVNTLTPSSEKSELIQHLNITKPALMFCDIELFELIQECLNELENDAKIFTFGGSKSGSEPIENLFTETHTENDFVSVTVDSVNDAAFITYSSGTTGRPKGVCISHASLLVGAPWHVSRWDDVMLYLNTLDWISGIYILIQGTLCGALRIITTEDFSPELQLHLIEKYKVTFTYNPPQYLLLMLKHENIDKTNLASMRVLMCGGSRMPPHIIIGIEKRFQNGFVYNDYGLSELDLLTGRDFRSADAKDTVGKVCNGTYIKIVDKNGNRLGPNKDGEVCAKKMHHKFAGYYGNKKATDDIIDAEGFLKTGDIGHFDDNGCLYLVDRIKEFIRYNCYFVSPSEIEVFLLESKDIHSACVVGIVDETNELPAAMIVRADSSNISEQDVYDLVAGQFPSYYKLRGGIYFTDALPTNPSGKVLRKTVQQMIVPLWMQSRIKF